MTTEPTPDELEQFRAWQAARERVEEPGHLDSLQRDLAEFSKGIGVIEGSLMARPCQHIEDGKVCGRRWEGHPSGHSYRPTPLITNATPSKGSYKRDGSEAAPTPEAEPLAAYLSVADAAKALSVKAADVKRMLAEGALGADRIGTVVLVKRLSVERVLAITEMSREESA